MNQTLQTNALHEILVAALKDAVAATTEAVIAEATATFEKRLRREVGLAGLEVSRFFEVSTMRDRVVITIKTEPGRDE